MRRRRCHRILCFLLSGCEIYWNRIMAISHTRLVSSCFCLYDQALLLFPQNQSLSEQALEAYTEVCNSISIDQLSFCRFTNQHTGSKTPRFHLSFEHLRMRESWIDHSRVVWWSNPRYLTPDTWLLNYQLSRSHRSFLAWLVLKPSLDTRKSDDHL